MRSVMPVLITLVISVATFYGGIYYGVMRTDVYIEKTIEKKFVVKKNFSAECRKKFQFVSWIFFRIFL